MGFSLLASFGIVFLGILGGSAILSFRQYLRGELPGVQALLYGAAPLILLLGCMVLCLVGSQVHAFVARAKFNRRFTTADGPAMPGNWVPGVVAIYLCDDERLSRNAQVSEVAISLATVIGSDLKAEGCPFLGKDICLRASEIYEKRIHDDYAREKGLMPVGKPALVSDAMRALVFARSVSKSGRRI